MEIKLGWDEMVELVYRQRLELDGVTLTFDRPGGRMWLTSSAGGIQERLPLRNPEAEDAQLLLMVLNRVIAGGGTAPVLAPPELAGLRRVTGELEEMLHDDNAE